MRAAAALAEILRREGIDVLFGYPRNQLLEAAAIADIRTIIVRQERIGLHMADAVSRLTRGKKLGAFCMQQGPGCENAYGGVAQAYGDSVPVLVLPAGYPRRLAHVPFNFNSTRQMAGVSKHAEPVTTGAEIPNIMRRAFTQLRNGRPQPVVVEVPYDAFDDEVPEPLDYTPVLVARSAPDPEAVAEVARVLVAAKRPVIYAGQGVHWANAYTELQALAELLAIPVCTSLPGKSAFDETHPLSLGSGGNAYPRRVSHFPETAVRERLPILSILLNNSSMAIELKVMPQATEKYRATDISGDYAAMARAFGGYGERITSTAEIVPAIERGIAQTRAGRPALLEFMTSQETRISKP